MDLPNEKVNGKNKRIYFFRQLFSCCPIVINFFMVGLYMGAPTVIIPQIKKEASYSTDFITPALASWISSAASYTSIPWVIIITILSCRFGRKLCLILITFSVILGNVVFYLSTSVTELIIGLAMQGMLFSSILTITVMVVSEYTSPKFRGVLMTFKNATFYWGFWVSNAIGTFFHWKNIGILIFVCSILNLSSVLCCESPYWLAMKGRFVECAKVHRWLKGTDDESEEELQKLILSQQEHLDSKAKRNEQVKVQKYIKILKIISSKYFYKPLIYATLPLLLYNATGKIACSVYAIDIIKKITSSEQMAYKGMLILDAVTLVGMYSGCALSKFVTRRKQLLLFSSVGVTFLYLLSIYLYMIKFNTISENKYISLFLLVAYSINVSCGPLVLVTCCTAELSPLKHRTYFICTISFINSIFLSSTLKISPFVFILCGTPGAFLFYAISSTIFILILYKYLPETKGRTIQEIEELIVRDNSCDKNVSSIETMPLKES